MQRSLKTTLVILAAVTTVAACQPKKPKTQPQPLTTTTTPVEAPTVDVNPQPAPPAADPTPDPWSADILEVNRKAAADGLLGDVYFDFDRDELKPEARERLSKNAEFLKAHPEFQVTIEGHCDERGTNDYNLALGERRAAAARDYLTSLGVSGDRLRTVSYGEERPQCNQSSEGCWSQNRRAHFLITGRTNVG
jgi:peptidoglycan-associated lipoprotein